MYYSVFETTLCKMTIVGDETGITQLHMDCGEDQPREFEIDPGWERNTSFFREEIQQILDYLDGQRTSFDIVANPKGTAFQHQVWEALVEIPYGETMSYGEIAEKLHNPGAARAVGMAGAKNPIPIIIPCHRVVGADGDLTGFAFGVDIKEKLINLERGIG